MNRMAWDIYILMCSRRCLVVHPNLCFPKTMNAACLHIDNWQICTADSGLCANTRAGEDRIYAFFFCYSDENCLMFWIFFCVFVKVRSFLDWILFGWHFGCSECFSIESSRSFNIRMSLVQNQMHFELVWFIQTIGGSNNDEKLKLHATDCTSPGHIISFSFVCATAMNGIYPEPKNHCLVLHLRGAGMCIRNWNRNAFGLAQPQRTNHRFVSPRPLQRQFRRLFCVCILLCCSHIPIVCWLLCFHSDRTVQFGAAKGSVAVCVCPFASVICQQRVWLMTLYALFVSRILSSTLRLSACLHVCVRVCVSFAHHVCGWPINYPQQRHDSIHSHMKTPSENCLIHTWKSTSKWANREFTIAIECWAGRTRHISMRKFGQN